MVYAARRRSASASSLPKGFTLIELLVVIAIIAILAAILFPVFAQARAKARQTACLSNEKQIGSGLMMYAQDFDETLPIGNYGLNAASNPKWMDIVYPYVKSIQVFNCPTNIDYSLDYLPCTLDAGGTYCTNRSGYRFGTYGLSGANYRGTTYTGGIPTHNPTGAPLADIKQPSDTIFVAEIGYSVVDNTQSPSTVQLAGLNNASISWDSDAFNPYVNKTTSPPSLSFTKSGKVTPVALITHAGGANVLWCDGHAKWLTAEAMVATHTVSGHNITYLWTLEDD